MDPKRGIIFIFIIFFALTIVFAQTTAPPSELEKIAKAYSWLSTAANQTWNLMSAEENAFVLLALSYDSSLAAQGKNALMGKSKNNTCWPSPNCRVKETALAMLALSRLGLDTSKIQSWLFSQNATPTDLVWLLEIDTPEEANCSVSYDNQQYLFTIGSNKKLSSSAGPCLTLAREDYFFRIRQDCFAKTFSVTCDKSFIVALPYVKQNSDVLYVSNIVYSGSAQSQVDAKISAICFKNENENSCDYEGTAWVSLVLTRNQKDISSAMPYLAGYTPLNERYFPQVFLYVLTTKNEYLLSILEKQKLGNFWLATNSPYNRYYDTALVLFAIGAEGGEKIEKAKQFLLQSQSPSGSWQDSKKDTAFILYSVWPKSAVQISPDNLVITSPKPDCEDSGYYCVLAGACSLSNIKSNYECFGYSDSRICCSQPQTQKTCQEKNGQICNANEDCDGLIQSASDTNYCCIGTCIKETEDTCTIKNYHCKSSCGDDEEIVSSLKCPLYRDVCCRPVKNTKNRLWLWIILIVLLVGIIILIYLFRDKFRFFYYRIIKKPALPPQQPPRPPLKPATFRPAIPLPTRPTPPVQRLPSDVEATLRKIRRMS